MSEDVKTFKRGEMWYIANLKTPSLGRPGIILSNEKGCIHAPELSVVWTTTNMTIAKNRENVRLTTPQRNSVARCGCVAPVARNLFQYKMCDISPEEMLQIEKAVRWALDFKSDVGVTDLTLLKERDMYKTLYFEVLRELAKKQIAEELPIMVELEQEAAQFESEPEPEFVEEEPVAEEVIEEVIEEVVEIEEDSAPEEPEEPEKSEEIEDFEDEEYMSPESLMKPEPKKRKKKPKSSSGTKSTNKKKVNINRCTAYDLQCAFGFGRDTALVLIGHRNRYGNFTSMEEIAAVRRMGKTNMKKLEGRIEF